MEAVALTVDDFSPMVDDAWDDPQYHRTALMDLPELKWPQVEAIQEVEKHIATGQGKVMTIRSARQTMKNECSAMIAERVLWKYAHGDGGTYIRVAPTYKPQIELSKARLERFLRPDPLVNAIGWLPRLGYIYICGKAEVHFLSGQKSANVLGETASILLDIDEAHKIDQGKFEEEFAPMTASTNAPIVMWGVAADKTDLLYEYRTYNQAGEKDLNFQYPAWMWCEISETYAAHYTSRRDKLGADHPVILTQYDLEDMEAVGGYLKPRHRRSLFESDHERFEKPRSPRPGERRIYVAGVDIGGEEEEPEEGLLVEENPNRDSTVIYIAEVDLADKVNGLPMVRIVEIYQWTGKALGEAPSGLPGQQEIVLELLKKWHVKGACVDARGVGEQMAGFIRRRHKGVEAYKATAPSISDDCYAMLSWINNGQLKMFRDDGSEEYAELGRQARWVKYGIRAHDQMYIYKPKPDRHIDHVKAIHYVLRAAGDVFETRYE